MTEELIADITDQLTEHTEKLNELLDELQSILKDGDDISARLENSVALRAANITAAVGALRALVEVANFEAAGDVEDDEDSPEGD